MLRKSQEGVSALAVMLLGPLVAIFILVVIKLVPVYLEYSSVKSVLNGMISDRAETYTSPGMVRSTLFKRLDINEVKHVTNDNVEVTREGPVYTLTIDYEVSVPLFYNISVLVTFSDKGEVSAS
jgi:hypothetical protein